MMIREAVRIALDDVDVLDAGSADEGLLTAARERPDAILLDCVLAGMDGPAAARELAGADATSSIPILMLTASEPDDNPAPSVRGLIAKPFGLSTFARRLETLLGWTA